MIIKEEAQVLMQLITAIDEAQEKLEEMYLQRNLEGFDNVKKFIQNAQQKISEIIK